MSLSTLPPESAAAITAWLRNQPVCRQAVAAPDKPADGAEGSRIPSNTARVEKFATPQSARKPSLLLKSLQTPQTSGKHRRQTAEIAVPKSTPTQPAAPIAAKSAGSRESEQIDPLPDFDLGSLFDEDHCVFVGNRRRTETADWLPVTSVATQSPTATEQLVQDLSQVSSEAHNSTAARSSAGNGMDRRAYPRRESDGVVSVCRRSVANRLFERSPDLSWKLHASSLKGRLIDVSMTGMALAMREPLPDGTPISMQVSSRSLDQPTEVTGHVLRCTPIEGQLGGDNNWRMVCQLDNRLTFEQVHSLGKQMFAYTMV